MLKFGRAAFLPVFLSATMAAAAGAQAAGAQDCNVDENNGGLSMAVFALMAAQQPGTAPAEVKRQLSTAIGRMFVDPQQVARDNAKNPAGRAFVLGKIYMMYLSQEGQPVITSRGQLGFKYDTATKVDLSVGIDSAFKVVEAAVPQCAPLTAQWRQQQGWVFLVQKAMDYANNNKVDSADIVAQQALRISPTAPYSHLVLGNVAAQRMQNMAAIDQYKQALAEAEKDTIFQDVRRTILYTLGNFANDAGTMDTVAANKKTYLTEAKNAFEALAKDPGKNYGDAARQGLTSVLRALGDTTAIKNACGPQVANPANFPFLSLIQCGVTLSEIDDAANAQKLFDAAAAMNPYHRDGLYNAALTQIRAAERVTDHADANPPDQVADAASRLEKVIPTIDKLVAVDPNNPDDLRLYVHVYNGIRKYQVMKNKAFGDSANKLTASKKAADIAHRKQLIDSAAKWGPMQQASLNKLVDWNTKADSMPMKVEFTEFTPGATKTTLSGDIINRTDKEQSYTLNVEFLDKTGKVVGTGKATVDKVRPNGRGNFSLASTVADIAAFKYSPLTP
jgi:tetratricopeptide (TPR) repeat protein